MVVRPWFSEFRIADHGYVYRVYRRLVCDKIPWVYIVQFRLQLVLLYMDHRVEAHLIL